MLDSSDVLPPSAASRTSTDETDLPQQPPHKRIRQREPSEDGELGPSSLASRPIIKPLASELHPDRVAMLRDPSPEVEAQPVKIISRTKANYLEMPFNRLEQRQLQRAMTHFSTPTNTDSGRSPAHQMLRAREEVQGRILAEEAGNVASRGEHVSNNTRSKVYAAGRANEKRVDNFLRTLEPDVPALSQRSERFGRLSPVPEITSGMPGTPAPSASPTCLQLEAELETYVLWKHGGPEVEVVIKSETRL